MRPLVGGGGVWPASRGDSGGGVDDRPGGGGGGVGRCRHPRADVLVDIPDGAEGTRHLVIHADVEAFFDEHEHVRRVEAVEIEILPQQGGRVYGRGLQLELLDEQAVQGCDQIFSVRSHRQEKPPPLSLPVSHTIRKGDCRRVRRQPPSTSYIQTDPPTEAWRQRSTGPGIKPLIRPFIHTLPEFYLSAGEDPDQMVIFR